MRRDPGYQRNRRGPSSAPTAVGIIMPSRYQKPMNGAPISEQCKQYTSAPVVPASSPAAAPASRSRVGASPLIAHRTAMNTGTESVAMKSGQDVHVFPKNSPARPVGSAPASTTNASAHIANTGAASAPGTQASRTPGRDRRIAARTLAAARLPTNATFTQNMGSRTALAMSARTPSSMAMSSAAPNAPEAMAVA